MRLYLDDLIDAEEAQVILVWDKPQDDNRAKTSWRSYISDDVNISSEASYTSPWAEVGAQTQETISKYQTAWAGVMSFLGGSESKFSGVSIQTYAQSIMHWTSSERPTFSINMQFVTWREDQKTLDDAISLASMPLPGIYEGATMTRPGGYVGFSEDAEGNVSAAKNVKGTWALKIGTWLEARNLILTQANLVLSKERTTTGEPLYATVECSLIPYQMTSYDDFLGWFKNVRR